MQLSPPLPTAPTRTPTITARPYPKFNRFFGYKIDLVGACGREFPAGPEVPAASAPFIQSNIGAASQTSLLEKVDTLEEGLEKAIYRCRFIIIFMALLGVLGSLIGSLLCFVKGCVYIAASFSEYFVNRGKVILLLVEAIDVYLLGL